MGAWGLSTGLGMCFVLVSLLAALPVHAHAQYVGVAASPRAPVIAAWTSEALRVSRDDGASFTERYAPPAPMTIVSAAVDDDGTVLVAWASARGDAIVELVAPDGTRTATPSEGVRAVATGHGTRAFVTEEAVFVARRGGAFAGIPHAPACLDCEGAIGSVALTVDARGQVVITDVEINTCGSRDRLEWQRIGHLRASESAVRWASARLPDTAGGAVMHPGAFGWSYGATVDGTLWARAPGRTVPLTELGPGAPYEVLDLATNGRITLLLWDDRLYQLRGARVIELDPHPGDVAALAVDARGRALAIDAEGGLVRFSRRTGWARVLDPPT